MKVHFFERYYIPGVISIEKVFSVIKRNLIERNIEVESYNNPYPTMFNMIKAMRFFRSNQGDINHITGDIHWACLFLDRNKTVMTIHDLVGLQNYSSPCKKKLYKFLWLYLPLKKLKYITVISEKTKSEILSNFPWAEPKIKVIHNPLTSDIFFRKTFKKNTSAFKILIVGTRENKNIERVLEATKDLNIEIFIVGGISSLQMQLIGLSNSKISFNNNLSEQELLGLYRSCDVLCFPSLYEGFGMPIIEAQSNGCAVITSNIEPMKSVAGDAALYVNPTEVGDIKAKIIIMMNNFELRKDIVSKGYENAKKYSSETISEQYLNYYKEILNG